MSAHARLSASGAHRWLVCPGSVELESRYPDQRSAYADEGTIAHDLAQICLRQGINAHGLPQADEWAVYPADMRDHVQTYLDYVRAVPGDLIVEERVDFSPWVPDGFGTADAIVVADGVAEVIDLKYGQGVRVDAQSNPQTRLYALGATHELGHLYDIHTWRLTIVQPRLDHIDSEDIRTPDLLAWGDSVRDRAQAALAPNAPLIPDEKACRFCRARSTCRARAERHLATARQEFGVYPKPALLEPEEIARVLAEFDAMRTWIGDVEGYALQQALAGNAPPGWKVVEGRSQRRWGESSLVAEAMRTAGLTDETIWRKSLIPITDAERLLGKKSPVLALTVKPPGKPTLVPDSDTRPALSTASANQDFDAVTTE